MVEWFAVNALALSLALLLDAVLGEPDWLWKRLPHPVMLIGRLIGWLDRRFNLDIQPAGKRKQAGLAALALLLAIVGAGTWLILALLGTIHPALVFGAQVLVGAVLLAQRSLHDHVAAVATPLEAGDLPAARTALSMIVGRRTEELDESGIARAALESLAENHSDGVIAPAFWMLIAGAPGIAVYKALNTADSMIGHRTARHLAFGWASARLDDGLNLLPARLSVGLILLGVLGAKLLRYPVELAWPRLASLAGDAATHASPNAGWPEAAYARALGIALGGPRDYADHRVDAPFLNRDGRRQLRAADIRAGLYLFQATCGATLVLVFLLALGGL